MALSLWCAPGAPARAPAPEEEMRTYRSAQYELRTDVTENEAREALVRLEALAQAYQRWLIRPEGGGADDRPAVAPPPLLKRVTVFRDIDAYEAAGGAAGSGGQFDSAVEAGEGGSLMVFAGPRVDAPTWGRLQHEAFHQLEHRTFPRDGPAELPPWLSEGLAEYFGHGMFTGDRLMPGTIASERLARVKVTGRTRSASSPTALRATPLRIRPASNTCSMLSSDPRSVERYVRHADVSDHRSCQSGMPEMVPRLRPSSP